MPRILVMGDEETIVGFISEGLEEKGFTVIIIKSLKEAFLELAQKQYDIFLPTNFGIGSLEADAVSRIKEKYPNLILIPLSGYYDQNYVNDLFNHGADDFLKAPFKIQDLVSKIQKISSKDIRGLPDLTTWNDKCLMILKYNARIRTYEKNGEAIPPSMMKLPSPVQEAFPHISKIESGYKYIYLCLKNKESLRNKNCSVIKIDHNFQYIDSRIFQNFGDMVIDDSGVIVAAEENLMVMDKNLKDRGKVRLEISNGFTQNKNAHSILIYSKTAYLLDNIMRPMYILNVDINDPREMAIKRRLFIKGVNSHLTHQWLDPDLEKWFVLSSYWHLGGYGQYLYTFHMSYGIEPLTEQFIGGREWDGRDNWGKPKGLQIIGTSQFPPILAVVMDKNDNYLLSQIRLFNKGVKFERIWDIPELSKAKMVKAKFIDNLLFLMADGSLMVMDTQVDPISFVTSINLAKYGMDSMEGVTTIK